MNIPRYLKSPAACITYAIAIAGTALGSSAAAVASTGAASTLCPTNYTCQWQVASVSNIPGSEARPWYTCINFGASARNRDVTCNLASTSHSTSAVVRGVNAVGDQTLSLAAQYPVTRTVAMTASKSYLISAQHSGKIQFAAVYGNIKSVRQVYMKRLSADTAANYSSVTSVKPVTAYTEQYVGPSFRLELN